MIYIAADHAGFELKKEIQSYLTKEGYRVKDLGPKTFNPEDDYPDFAFPLAQKTAADPKNKGILLCRSGIGMTIAANKVKGAQAALCLFELQAQKARRYNDANIIVLAADFTGKKEIKKIIRKFLGTKFSKEERHTRRVKKIEKFEKK